MVEEQILDRGVFNPSVLQVMREVPRHCFVPRAHRDQAYEDHPLPIGSDQTISQPYIVALMTELAQVGRDAVVLEVGAGSGYQAAVLALLVKQVFALEHLAPLATSAGRRLKALDFRNVEVGVGDGYMGWPEHQPYDAILASAAIDHVPQALLDQLKPEGRIVLPLARTGDSQMLVVVQKSPDGRGIEREIIPVRFVPFVRSGEIREWGER
jgi:protein-L-isoaspartate(D-aspartate) O-methyltransferase